ncbi:LysM peptidoglycan-binding domain-containing protein [Jannaschia sp. CCS1]|uniref:LysM peptidoglycan-binding domain-containing protein n=1 Tax=Jannaschia sp. (strain CCS1) TaxID=290400 RepID=UPI000053A18E|nr:LysM peptidoglycan-binding domain-containing protein [Jannaschia sp. CCS1]ABD55110.1 Peptidoglycan-binding LysM [Jannaschia sp. CCS1]
MKLAAMFGSSSGAVGATAVGAVALVAGAIGFTVFNGSGAPLQDQPVALVVADGALADPAMEAAGTATLPDPVPGIEPPRLDLVRVEAGGETVIAGQTSPDITVVILLDGLQFAVTRSDGAGDFVSLVTLPPSPMPRALSVEAWPENAPVLAGLETVFIAPVTGPGAQPSATAGGPGGGEVAALDPSTIMDPDGPQGVAADSGAGAGDIAPVDGVEIGAVPDEEQVALVVPAVEALPAATPSAGPADTAPDAPLDGATQAPSVVGDASPPAAGAEETVEIASLQPGDDAPTPASTGSGPGVASSGPGSLTTPTLSAAPAAAPPASTGDGTPRPARAAAPAVVIAGPEGVRVVQGPTPEPEVQTSVRLDAISYDAEGQVILAGRGPVAADIQVYLNNQPIQLGEIGPGGAWSLQLPDVDPGTYTLAVAELAEDGSTTSRVETPFLREDPDRVAEAPVAQAAGIDVITVQPGFTLWGIAQDMFGDGILYVQIFDENQDQIRDPNWIFPGQIFRLPDVEQSNREN